jgi:hypothetical protein
MERDHWIEILRSTGVHEPANPAFTMSKISKNAHLFVRNAVFQSDDPSFGHMRVSWPGPKFGGADRDRTDDLKLAKLALSQLSYGPRFNVTGNLWLQMVGPGRVERPTSRLSGVRSNHLSYEPD